MLFHAIIGLKSMDADGLKSYGYDEQLISLKSWLYGEGCSLISRSLIFA